MSSNKEADLTTAVLLYAMRCLAEGDQQALRAMNFGPKELDALKEMNLADIYRADALRVHCLQIGLNRDVFWPMLEHLRHQRESEDLQRKLLAADAPLEMMQQLFGLSSREYTRWRRLLTLAPSVGRPAELNEPDTHALWYAWQELQEKQERSTLSAADYLELQQQTCIGLRAIWVLVQRWEAYGEGTSTAPITRVQSMADEEKTLRPETIALDALIKATVAKIRAQSDPSFPDAMLFMGNWHQAVPAMVIQDPVLEPVDKLVWMVIMLHARETGGRTAFPDYDTIASKTNVSSTSTVSRAIAILRLTRWLTLCARIRQTSGRFTGNVYILHDEPLPLVDAIYLDDAYMAFVTQSEEHHHARVRRVAQAVTASLDMDIRRGEHVGGQESAIERRLQAVKILADTSRNQDKSGRYFTFNAAALSQLKNPSDAGIAEQSDQHQNSKAETKTHYSSGCSSHYKKTTTTTTTQNTDNRKHVFSESSQSIPLPTDQTLIYPPRLSENQKLLADRYLAMIAPEDRQLVLDELQGRLSSEQKGMKPVYDELRFLHSLCKAAQKDEFVPNLGIKVAEARKERVLHVQPLEDETQKAKTAEERERSQAYAREQLAKLRASLNMNKK